MDKATKARFDAAVQAEVASQMAALQQQFAQTMEFAMKSGLQGLDGANASLEKERAAVANERDATQELHRQAEREGDRMAEEYFEKSRAAVVEFTQRDQLRGLARTHLEAGRSVDEICLWLKVEPAFVEAIVEVMDRGVDFRRAQRERTFIQLPGNPRLRYRDEGRSGAITFENDETSFDLWWELGFGSALAIVDIPTPYQWKARTKLPLDQRDDVLRFIAERVAMDQAPGGHGFDIGESVITILR